MSMTEKSYLGLGRHGFHRIAFYQWGEAHNRRSVICVHGLTRTGRDFDFLAEALEDQYRVACPDLPGRGNSHWLTVAADYRPVTYLADMASLIARLGVEEVDWVGTSLGGILGMTLAAQPNTPIRKLVLNDIGAYVGKPALERIAEYVGKNPQFRDLKSVEAYLREVHAPFGPLTDAEWAFLAKHSARIDPATGIWRLHYDPRIAEPFKEDFSADLDFWPVWEAISCPVLILRGEQSDVLDKATAEEMLTRGPEAELIEFPGIGHAPMLFNSAQIAPVREWLLS